MVIRYEDYVGILIYAEQIEKDKFKIGIQDANDAKIYFTCSICDLKLVDCIGNIPFLSEINIHKID